MKRLITCLVGVALLCGIGFAKEFNNGISNGGFFVLEGNMGEGFGEWSFPILTTENNFMLRDNISLGGFGCAENGTNVDLGGASLGNKFIFGGIYDYAECFIAKTYGFIGIELGFFSAANHNIFSPSFMLCPMMGGGFELQYTKRNSFVVEFGGKYRYVVGKNMSSYKQFNNINPIVMIGFRSYIENRN